MGLFRIKETVLEVYRITLLSNDNNRVYPARNVLEVYRITLLSNMRDNLERIDAVLEVYRITLLSNQVKSRKA